jgi:hypothetical protein
LKSVLGEKGQPNTISMRRGREGCSIIKVCGNEPAAAIADARVPASAHAVASPTAPVMASASWRAYLMK